MREREPAPMNAPALPPMQPAGLWRRAAARTIDALCMLMLYALAWLVVGILFTILAVAGQVDLVFGTSGGGLVEMVIVLMMVLVLVSVYRYEVVPTTQRGQTFGKQTMGLCVVRCSARQGIVVAPPSRASSMRRWAIPHGATILSIKIVLVGVAAGWLPDSEILLLSVGALAAVAWAACYVSALFGKHRRGWHDKAADTIVVRATDEVLERLATPETAAREPGPKGRGADDPSEQAFTDWSRDWSRACRHP